MAYMIEITEDNMQCLAENAEKMLRYGGKVMQCIDQMRQEGQQNMGERGGMRDERDYRDYPQVYRSGYRNDREYIGRGGYRSGNGGY